MSDSYKKYEEMYEVTEKLKEYTEVEGTELGETCEALISLWECSSCVSDEFCAALEKELKAQLKNFVDNSKIITTEITVNKKVNRLQWDE